MKFKKNWGFAIILTLILILSVNVSTAQARSQTVVVGSQGSDAQIWRYISRSTAAKKAHLKIRVKEINDGIQLNRATSEGSVDANAFQSASYLQSYNKDNPNGKLTILATTYLEPLGLYYKKYKSLKQLPDHAKIAIADDPANQTRSLQLLQTAGLIKLNKTRDQTASVNDLKANPHHFRFYQVNSSTVARVLNDVAAGLITNTIAQESGLNVWHDSILHEKLDRSTQKNINIIAASPKNSRRPEIKKLVKVYHQPAVKRYIRNSFHHTKVLVKEPVSKLKE